MSHQQNFENTVARMIAAHAAGESYTLNHQELTDYLSAVAWLNVLMKAATELAGDKSAALKPPSDPGQQSRYRMLGFDESQWTAIIDRAGCPVPETVEEFAVAWQRWLDLGLPVNPVGTRATQEIINAIARHC